MTDLSIENVTKEIVRVEQREHSTSLSNFSTANTPRALITFVTLTALRACTASLYLNNRDAHSAINAWMHARPGMRGRWARGYDLMWRRRKQIRRRMRAGRAAA